MEFVTGLPLVCSHITGPFLLSPMFLLVSQGLFFFLCIALHFCFAKSGTEYCQPLESYLQFTSKCIKTSSRCPAQSNSLFGS